MQSVTEITERLRDLITDNPVLATTDPSLQRARRRARLERLIVGKVEAPVAGRWRGAVLMKAEQTYDHYIVMDPDDYANAIMDSYRTMLRDARILQRQTGLTTLQAQTEIVQRIEDQQRKTFTRL